MRRELRFTPESDCQLSEIENNPNLAGTLKQVRKTLGLLETNLRSKSLQTHLHHSLTKRYGEKIFDAYAQQNTPGAFRIFWHYGPDEEDESGNRVSIITIVLITPHP